jgi:hypothetical protein
MDKKTMDIELTAERDTSFDLKFPGEVAGLECSQAGVLKRSKYGENYRAISLDKGDNISIQVKLML